MNAIRSLSQSPAASTPESKTALAAFTTPDALDAVAGLLAAPYPVLMNEGLVALSLASLSQKQGVEDALLRPSRVQTAPASQTSQASSSAQGAQGQQGDDKGAKRVDLDQTEKLRPVDKLVKILDPSPASDNVGPEIKANAATLVKSVGGKVDEIVKGGA